MVKFNNDPTEYEDIGHDTYIAYFSTTSVEKAGLIEVHKKPDGELCFGSVYFEGTKGDGPKWKVESLEPLTISPSLLCKVCGHHGFIRQGKWVPA